MSRPSMLFATAAPPTRSPIRLNAARAQPMDRHDPSAQDESYRSTHWPPPGASAERSAGSVKQVPGDIPLVSEPAHHVAMLTTWRPVEYCHLRHVVAAQVQMDRGLGARVLRHDPP